jgi:hypothetical protein
MDDHNRDLPATVERCSDCETNPSTHTLGGEPLCDVCGLPWDTEDE